MQTLLFYDVESTGLGVFDQVIQFAAIRTDLALNELERTAFDVQLTPDCVPSPDALCVHRIGTDRLLSARSLAKATSDIHALLNQPGTHSGGYNTLGFDDEFLRFSFFQHLLPPYTHQYASGCGRFDLYPMMVFYYLYKPEVLSWPEHEDGVSLKLEAIANCNGLMQGEAHDALVDVEATIALAKCLQKDQAMWQYVLGFFDKKTDQKRLAALGSINIAGHAYSLGYMVQGRLGFKRSFQVPVMGLGRHKHYGNQTLWLSLDDPFWLSFDPHLAIEEVGVPVFRKKDGEPGFILPMKPRFSRLSTERQEIVNVALKCLRDHPAWLEQLAYHHRDQQYETVECDVEAALYQLPFPSKEDVQLMQRFHQVPAEEKVSMLPRFSTHHRLLAERFLWRYHPEAIVKPSAGLQDFIATRHVGSQIPVLDHRGHERLSVAKALARIEELLQVDATDEQQGLLASLRYYLTHLGVVHPQWEKTWLEAML